MQLSEEMNLHIFNFFKFILGSEMHYAKYSGAIKKLSDHEKVFFF